MEQQSSELQGSNCRLQQQTQDRPSSRLIRTTRMSRSGMRFPTIAPKEIERGKKGLHPYRARKGEGKMQSDSLQRIKTCSVPLDPYLDVCACIMMTLPPKLKPGILNELAKICQNSLKLRSLYLSVIRSKEDHLILILIISVSVPKDLWIMTASPCLLRHYLGYSKERLSYVQQQTDRDQV